MPFARDIWDNRFKLGQSLKRDRTFEIWSAYDTEDNDKKVVIKRARGHGTSSVQNAQAKLLRKEATLLKRLNEVSLEAVPAVLMEGYTPTYYFVMEDIRFSDKSAPRHVFLNNRKGFDTDDEAPLKRSSLNQRLADPLHPFEAVLLLEQIGRLLVVLEEQGIVHGHLTGRNLFWHFYFGLKVTGWRKAEANSQRLNEASDTRSVLVGLLPKIIRYVEKWPDAEWETTLKGLSEHVRNNNLNMLAAKAFHGPIQMLLYNIKRSIEQDKSFIRNANAEQARQADAALGRLYEIDPYDLELDEELEAIVERLDEEKQLLHVWGWLQEEDFLAVRRPIERLLRQNPNSGSQSVRIAYWLSQAMRQNPPECDWPSTERLLPDSLALPPSAEYLWRQVRHCYLSHECSSEVVHLLLAEIRGALLPLSLRVSYLRHALKKHPPLPGYPTARQINDRWHQLYSSSNQITLVSLLSAYQALEKELKQLQQSKWVLPTNLGREPWQQRTEQTLADLRRFARWTSKISAELQTALAAEQDQDYNKVVKKLDSALRRDNESQPLQQLLEQAIGAREAHAAIMKVIDRRPNEELDKYLRKIEVTLVTKKGVLAHDPTIKRYAAWFEHESKEFLNFWHKLQNSLEDGKAEEAENLLKNLADTLRGLGDPLESKIEQAYLLPSRQRVASIKDARQRMNEAYAYWEQGDSTNAAVTLEAVHPSHLPSQDRASFYDLKITLEAVSDLEDGHNEFLLTKAATEEVLYRSDGSQNRSERHERLRRFAFDLLAAYQQAGEGDFDFKATQEQVAKLGVEYAQQANLRVMTQLNEVIEWMEGLQSAAHVFSTGRWGEVSESLPQEQSLPAIFQDSQLHQQKMMLAEAAYAIKQIFRDWREGRYQDAYQQAREVEQQVSRLPNVNGKAVKELVRALQAIVDEQEAWQQPDKPREPDASTLLKPLEVILEHEEQYKTFLSPSTRTQERLDDLEQLLRHLRDGTPNSQMLTYIDGLLKKEDDKYLYHNWLVRLQFTLSSDDSSEQHTPSRIEENRSKPKDQKQGHSANTTMAHFFKSFLNRKKQSE